VKDIRAGTPGYMAPEQLRGREVTARSDIFALGLVLYELFTGRRAFDATSIEELMNQHDSRSVIPPSSIVRAIDPRIEQAILRCLEPDPGRRPGSALAVSAALPGGDPLAAALAAGRTPSPEMVAAAGEGVGLSPRQGWTVFVAALAAMVASVAIALRTSPLERIRPEYSAEVLAQKARDAIRQLGYPQRARDEAYGFRWDEAFIEHVHESDKPAVRWDEVFSQRPSPLVFWYRRSSEPLTALAFHTDLLTPGIVGRDDPPPIVSGMIQMEMDHEGRLTFFETIPPQRQEAPAAVKTADWSPLLQLAGLDPAQLQPAEPLWTWLAGSDTRVAWTGAWPESGRPLRIEAAANEGRPVAFMLVGSWRTPWRMPEESSPRENALAIMVFAIALVVLGGAGALARANLRTGRGDRKGATRLAVSMSCVLMALWACQTHLVASLGLLGTLLIAVSTSVFYGVLLWTVYVALEPSVRRHWPQVLVSWTNVLAGRPRDPVVGRDVLIGAAFGAAWVLLLRLADLASAVAAYATFPGALELLSSPRSTAGVVFKEAPYAIRNVLLFFFLLFVLRRLLRSQWAAAIAFASFFAVLNALGNENAPWISLLLGFLYFGSGAYAVLRWGLLSYAVGVFVGALLMDMPATLDTSAWYFGHVILIGATVLALAVWGLRTSVAGRLWHVDSA
jgi:serine/threonine-protein kinase